MSVPASVRTSHGPVDGAGRPLRWWVLMNRRDHDDAIAMHTALDGTFAFEGLPPGTWDATANDAGAGAALAIDLQVQPGCDAGPITLTLQPGGVLVVIGSGGLLLRRGDAVVLRDNMPTGAPYRLWLAPGEYQVTLGEGVVPKTFVARVTAGGETVVGP